jgi:hypothetical protein
MAITTKVGSTVTNTYERSREQKDRYADAKRANYFLKHYGEGRKKYWRIGAKRFSKRTLKTILKKEEFGEEHKRSRYFVYDVRVKERTGKQKPLRGMGNVNIRDFLPPDINLYNDDHYALVKAATAGEIPAGCYLPNESGSRRKDPIRMPRGYGQRGYLQPRTDRSPRKRPMSKPLVEETHADIKEHVWGAEDSELDSGFQELNPEQLSKLITVLRSMQSNIFTTHIECPMCDAQKSAAVRKYGEIECFKCRQSCDASLALSEVNTSK